MIKNPTTGETIELTTIDIINNSAFGTYALDEFASKTDFSCQLPNLQEKLKRIPDVGKTILENIKYVAELELLDQSGYETWIENGHVTWDEPDWNYRLYATFEQIVKITDSSVYWIVSLYEEPKNPSYKKKEGVLIYLNNISQEQKEFLDYLSINIEEKPIV